jgi:hypothetical protein
MACKNILAMLLGQMSNTVLNVEIRVFPGFSSLRAGISSFNMHMVMISFLHYEYKSTNAGPENIELKAAREERHRSFHPLLFI